MRSVLVYIAIYSGVFLLLHRMFRRWWYGAVGLVIATILTLWSQLAVGLWALLATLLSVAGLVLLVCATRTPRAHVSKNRAPHPFGGGALFVGSYFPPTPDFRASSSW